MDTDSNDFESGVLIDQFNADLNLIIDKECLLAYPISGDGFCSMWAGCRANYGVDKAKVVFEINLEDYCECPDIPKCSESEPHMIRVGWSVAESSTQLGENKFSFAYCNNGKICNDKIFEDYGETFEKGDSVASYVDFESDQSKILISFSKNGIDMGLAFTIDKTDLIESYEKEFLHKKTLNADLVRTEEEMKQTENCSDKSIILFPHVLTKNIVFEMNFGQRVSLIGDEPFAPIKPGYFLIQKIPIENRYCTDMEQRSQTELEAIMLVGLPGVGKTNWAIEHSKMNPNKNFCIMGMSTILEKMKNVGKKPSTAELACTKAIEESKQSNTDAKETEKSTEGSSKPTAAQILATKMQMELLDKVLKCMNILIDTAAQANRNIIIDQPNIYESTRRRKMKVFEKYTKRRAIVLMPSYEDYVKSLVTNEKSTNETYMSLVNDMKANLTLPEVNDLFQSVEYVGMDEDQVKQLVEFYRKEGSENRLNLIIDKRLKKKLASKQNVAARAAKLGPTRFHNSSTFPGQPYPVEMGNRSRFTSSGFPNSMNNKRFMNNSYYNQSIRMNSNRFPPNINIVPMMSGYVRAPMFLNNPLPPNFQAVGMPSAYNVLQQPQHPQYNLNHSWPSATSTEIWNQQRMQQPTTSNWAPALPISNLSQQKQQPMMMNMNGYAPRQPAVWPTSGESKIGTNGPIVDAWPSANQPN